jgi:N-acyl-D-amino-acid deacylase
VVFDPKTVDDTATYEEPRQYPRGIARVIVNGQVVVKDGKPERRPTGQVLSRA